MDLQQLRAVITVAREESFSRAAEALFITQPAISMQIKRLEEEMGASLFDRSARRVELTQAGKLMAQHAGRIFDEVALAHQSMAELKGLTRGTLVIGCSDTLSRFFLASRLGKFLQAYPAIEVNLVNRTTPEIITQVKQRSLDMGFVLLPVHSDQLSIRHILDYREVAVCAPGHELATRRRVALDEIVDFPLLLLEPGTSSRALLDQDFDRLGLRPGRAMELGSVEVQKELARIGLGVAIVPEFSVTSEDLHVLKLRQAKRRSIGLITRSDRAIPATASALLDFL